jgi:outer membrane protein
MQRLGYLAALAPLLLAPGAAFADTLENALAAAYENNPNMEEARLAVRAARQDRVQARAGYLPSLTVSGNYGIEELETETTSIFGPSESVTELNPSTTSVELNQSLFTGWRRLGNSRLARAGVDNAQETLRATEQEVLLAAVDAYLNVRRDEEIVRLNEEHVIGLMRQLAGTNRRLEVGEVSRTDVAQAETRLAGARASLARAQAELERTRARYEEIVGLPPEALEPVDTLPELPASLDDALALALDAHPDLGRARANEGAARARVTIERAALLPQVSIVGRYDRTEESSFENDRREGPSAVARFSMPIFEGGVGWSRAHQSRINVRRAEALTEAQRRQVSSNVIGAWNDLIAARDVLEAANEQVRASQLALTGAERERGLGMRSTLDVLDAEEEARNARVNQARAEANAVLAAFVLSAATGHLTLAELAGDEEQ